MSLLDHLEAQDLATLTKLYLVTDAGWRPLAIASRQMREWDGGNGRVLVYSERYNICGYVQIKVTGRKTRWMDYETSLVTVQVDNGEETYRAEVAIPRTMTLAEIKALLEERQ